MAATDWYRRRSRRAAGMSPDELDHAISQICANPRQYPVPEVGTRRVVLRRFPYGHLSRYRFRPEIVAVAQDIAVPGTGWIGLNDSFGGTDSRILGMHLLGARWLTVA